jgi:D-beta-D-heptose 7-phosphate kinase/D-beta-D-heptose 1-phosphate adenosyltransferase
VKILSFMALVREAPRYKDRIILATGCFDILHPGHVRLLEMAADYNLAMYLWVGINGDEGVRQLKGDKRPINCYTDRATVVAALECVNRVFEILEFRVTEAIRVVRPAVWIKGGDYTMDTLHKGEVAAAKEVGAEVVIIQTIPGYSTTNILKKLNA